jgi:hypothetical protein
LEEIEIIIDFSDLTLAETDGDYEEVKEVMIKEIPNYDKWVLRSDVTILSPSGISSMEIQCHGDGSIYILKYAPSIADVYYNNDIQAISLWAQEKGWKIPQPKYTLVEDNKQFWKHFWETLVIDSDYLDKLYGERKQLG